MTAEDVLQFWSFLFLGVLVYAMGAQAKNVFPKLYAKKWFQRTVVFHAPVVATLIASLPVFPMPDMLGDSIGARLLYGVVCGITCAWSYKAVKRLFGVDTKSRGDE